MSFHFPKIALALSIPLFGITALSEYNNPPASPPVTQDSKIIQFLSETLSWYHQRAVEQKLAVGASDLAFLQENRRIADQVVPLAFEYARNQAQLQPKQLGSQPGQQQPPALVDSSGQWQRLTLAVQKLDQQIQDTQTELQDARAKLVNAAPSKRALIESQVAELHSEVALLEARREALQSMLEFVNSSSKGGGTVGLRAQIEELARSVPAALGRSQATNQGDSKDETRSSDPLVQSREQPSGIWGVTADLIRLSGKMHSIKDEIVATENLRKQATDRSAPLIENLRNLIHQGDQVFAGADTAGPSLLAEQKQQLDTLTAQFKQTTAGLLPLSKVGVLLGIYENSLTNWRESVRDEFHDELRQLLLRLAVLLSLVALVFGIGEVWRRTTFRYVHDVRRRYQFLLLRRIAMWTAIALIVVLAFATQLGSAVTFAGLLTAGVAVALQNVIISVVGYFFLIGKYGLRVGDRVQIAGVTGEVVEIGLVRIHLMELGGPSDSQPSGRVVAFSNSIVFQPTAGVFKQIPGTDFVWHELKLTLAPETDYHAAKDRISEAVDAALGNYRDNIETQRRQLEKNLSSVSAAELQPRIRLHYAGSGIEATVRFPVELGKATEIDDHLMRELLAALGREPKLKLLSAEMPLAKVGV